MFSLSLILLLQAPVTATTTPPAYIDSTRTGVLPTISVEAPKPLPASSTQKEVSASALDPNKTASDVPEALTQTPSVTTYSDAGTGFGYSYFRLRGLEATRTTISLDGLPLSEPEDQGMYFSNLPAFVPSTSNLVITRGSAPSSSGLTSYAGALDFSLRLPLTKQVYFSQLYGSFGTRRSALSLSSGLLGPWSLGLDAVSQSSDGYRANAFHRGLGLSFISLYTTPSTTFKASYQTGHVTNGMAYLATPLSLLRLDPRTNYSPIWPVSDPLALFRPFLVFGRETLWWGAVVLAPSSLCQFGS